MRTLQDHIVNPANDRLTIEVLDEPGQGNACHLYRLSGFDSISNPSYPLVGLLGTPATHAHLLFQNGPIGEAGVGVNGWTHEAMLAIICDRLRGFQSGPYACRENALALTKLEEAMHWLQQRTVARMRRGVEGTHQV